MWKIRWSNSKIPGNEGVEFCWKLLKGNSLEIPHSGMAEQGILKYSNFSSAVELFSIVTSCSQLELKGQQRLIPELQNSWEILSLPHFYASFNPQNSRQDSIHGICAELS